jgi:hypothetical protein
MLPKSWGPGAVIARFVEYAIKRWGAKTKLSTSEAMNFDWRKHPSADLIQKFIAGTPKLRVLYAFDRHAVMSQNRKYEPLLYKSGLVNISQLNFALPTAFRNVANYKGVSKYKNISDLWEGVDISVIKAWFEKKYIGKCRAPLASVAQVVAATDRTTSLGYPMNQKFRTKGYWFDSPNFEKDMRSFWDLLDASAVGEVFSVWNSFSKSEALKLSKILADELRQIAGSDGCVNVAAGCYSKGFNDKYVDDYRSGFSRAGVPIQHGGWQWLYQKHSRGGRYITAIEADVRKLDSSMPTVLMLLVWYIRQACIPNLTRQQRVRMLKLTLNVIKGCFVLPDGIVIQKDGGMCSGSDITLVTNGMIVEGYMVYSWDQLAQSHGLLVWDVDEFCVVSIVGDDVLLTHDECIKEWFTPQALVKVLADRGVGIEARQVRLEDAQFLSHKFRKYHMHGAIVPYPVNCHKAVANVLSPPIQCLEPTPKYPLLLARTLAQRNRFFADAEDPVQSYWNLFDSIAELYRGPAAKQRSMYPEDYASAMALDVPHYVVAELYCIRLEGLSDQRAQTLSKAMVRGRAQARAGELWLSLATDGEIESSEEG